MARSIYRTRQRRALSRVHQWQDRYCDLDGTVAAWLLGSRIHQLGMHALLYANNFPKECGRTPSVQAGALELMELGNEYIAGEHGNSVDMDVVGNIDALIDDLLAALES